MAGAEMTRIYTIGLSHSFDEVTLNSIKIEFFSHRVMQAGYLVERPIHSIAKYVSLKHQRGPENPEWLAHILLMLRSCKKNKYS